MENTVAATLASIDLSIPADAADHTPAAKVARMTTEQRHEMARDWRSTLSVPSYPTPWRTPRSIKHLSAEQLAAAGIVENSPEWLQYRSDYNTMTKLRDGRAYWSNMTGLYVLKPSERSEGDATGDSGEETDNSPRARLSRRFGKALEAVTDVREYLVERAAFTPTVCDDTASQASRELTNIEETMGALAVLLDTLTPEWGIKPAAEKVPAINPVAGDRFMISANFAAEMSDFVSEGEFNEPVTVLKVVSLNKQAVIKTGAGTKLPVPYSALRPLTA